MQHLFIPGQEVVCLKDQWTSPIDGQIVTPSYPTPKENEICIVTDSREFEDGIYISLKGYEGRYWQGAFAPVMPSDVLEENLREIFHQPVTII